MVLLFVVLIGNTWYVSGPHRRDGQDEQDVLPEAVARRRWLL